MVEKENRSLDELNLPLKYVLIVHLFGIVDVNIFFLKNSQS